MNAALLGCLTAVGWGGADFAARFSGRAPGHFSALLGMLIAGSAGLAVYAYAIDMPLVWETSAAWLLVVTGAGVMVATPLRHARHVTMLGAEGMNPLVARPAYEGR